MAKTAAVSIAEEKTIRNSN